MSTIPPLPQANELSTEVIDEIVHSRWAALTARFDAGMREKLTEDALAGTWSQVIEAMGTYQGHSDPTAHRPTDEFTFTDTMLNFEGGQLVARVTFRDDESIAGLFFLNPEVVAAAETE